MHIAMRSALLALLPLAVLGARKRDVASTPFQLYAYSEDIGGLPLFYADGLAYLGEPALSNSTDAAVVTFTIDANKHFIGNPNATTATGEPTWSNTALFIPSSSSVDRRVGFLPPNNGTGNTTTQTSGFAFYGSTVMLYGEDGTVATSFYGMKAENGLYELHWNDTEGKVPLTLRSMAPSSEASKRR
ncbi:hypothetical protein J4E83_009270 [Alternaria metachromatica]|uniref:uncharacterized protein n=1 Tax=Alternaria metachromatica TaxID=283354 RepID=UPI0020C25E85|nr:uncharacterized protein J4E83_009270 [Alternaria metachromatica]XP_051329681.1 uncharacterized protein J4E85_002548 [Alternaria conjuncta]KAI4608087.1 hypothetical protein J4E83_009270 [Alternaria metachromatica]KAI4934690.1 hypothetical protein J4E85_002548 [Alternaria conjuncta]